MKYTVEDVGREIFNSFESFNKKDRSFFCRRCKQKFTPKEGQWIFYNLCDDCFRLFDIQKMTGRFSSVFGHMTVKSFENVEEWLIANPIN